MGLGWVFGRITHRLAATDQLVRPNSNSTLRSRSGWQEGCLRFASSCVSPLLSCNFPRAEVMVNSGRSLEQSMILYQRSLLLSGLRIIHTIQYMQVGGQVGHGRAGLFPLDVTI